MGKLVKIIIQGVTSKKAQAELNDIMRCRNDILYFAKKCMILTSEGLKPFEPYPWQARLLKMLTTTPNRRDLVMAARQTGKTTVVAVFFLWYAMFHHDKNLWIFSRKDIAAKEIMQRIREMYANLPKHLRFETKHNSKSCIEFRDNHCKICASGLSDVYVVGRSLDYIWIDEAAYCHDCGMDTISSGSSRQETDSDARRSRGEMFLTVMRTGRRKPSVIMESPSSTKNLTARS